ncbi:mobilization protein MbpA (plasmid) [Tenacibaculum finnmarkense]|nr:mobilization protein MbpA [Tenacibaculum finnmarkense]
MIKKKRLELRCTALEKAIIKKKAENSGLSTSEFCRASALGQKIGSKFTDEEMEVYQTLHKFHKNFTALSNLFKAKNPSLSNETKVLADEIKQIIQKIK